MVMAIVGVVTTGVYSLFLTDGVQCTRFTVTAVVSGANPRLTHVLGNDTSLASSGAFTYPVATSMVCRIKTNQAITFALDTVDPTWLTRNTGGGARRLAPDVQSLSFSFSIAPAGPSLRP